jgi:hypothetical protein
VIRFARKTWGSSSCCYSVREPLGVVSLLALLLQDRWRGLAQIIAQWQSPHKRCIRQI